MRGGALFVLSHTKKPEQATLRVRAVLSVVAREALLEGFSFLEGEAFAECSEKDDGGSRVRDYAREHD